MFDEGKDKESESSLLMNGGWVYLLAEKKKLISMILPLFLVGAFVLFKFFSKGGSESDYVAAHLAYKKWESSQGAQGTFESLKNLVKKHPELQGRYDDLVAQNLIAQGDFDNAYEIAGRALERSAKLAPYWTDFGKTTLLIGKEEYQNALSEALRLKQEMSTDGEFDMTSSGALLYGVNLMRIAFLYQKMGDIKEELIAWHELKRYSEISEGDPLAKRSALDKLLSHFTAQNVSLFDYIRHREELLSKN